MEQMVESFVEAVVGATATGVGLGVVLGAGLGLLAGVVAALVARGLGASLGWVGGVILAVVLAAAGALGITPLVTVMSIEQAVAEQHDAMEAVSRVGADGVVAAAWVGGVNADDARFLAGHAAISREEFARALERFVAQHGIDADDGEVLVDELTGRLAPHREDPGRTAVVASMVAALGHEGLLDVDDLVPAQGPVDMAAVQRHLQSGGAVADITWSMRLTALSWAGFTALFGVAAIGLALLLARSRSGSPAEASATAS